MSSMRLFFRTDKPSQLKSFIDESLNINIMLEQVEDVSILDSGDLKSSSQGGWFEWYTYADWSSFDHCLFLAVIEQCAHLYTDVLELHSTLIDGVAYKPGQGLSFDRKAFIDHLEKYRLTNEWFDDEGHIRLPYPQELVNAGREPQQYLERFRINIS